MTTRQFVMGIEADAALAALRDKLTREHGARPSASAVVRQAVVRFAQAYNIPMELPQ